MKFKIRESQLKNSKQGSEMSRREEYEKTSNMDLVDYYIDLGNTFNWKVNRLSHIIGGEHFPSVGSYKERLLRDEISKFLPKQYSVGTGFIIFPKFVQSNSQFGDYSHDISKQVDVIIYNNTIVAPIFQDKDFVIVVPEAVVAIIEVKGNLSQNSKPMSGYEDIFEKWIRYKAMISNNLIQISAIHHSEIVAPYFFVYAFDEYVDKDNRVYDNRKTLNEIKVALTKIIRRYKVDSEYVLPSVLKETVKFGGWFCYNRYEISGTTKIDNITKYAKKVLCCIEGKKDGDPLSDITFVDMLSTIMCLCKIPYNSGAIRTHKEVATKRKILMQIDLYDMHTNEIL